MTILLAPEFLVLYRRFRVDPGLFRSSLGSNGSIGAYLFYPPVWASALWRKYRTILAKSSGHPFSLDSIILLHRGKKKEKKKTSLLDAGMSLPAASPSNVSHNSLRQDSEGIQLASKARPSGPGSEIARTIEAHVDDSNAPASGNAIGKASARADEVQAPELVEKPRGSGLLNSKVGSRAGSIFAFLALVSTSVFFALQYRQTNSFAIVSNNLAIEESCRSHPVSVNSPSTWKRT